MIDKESIKTSQKFFKIFFLIFSYSKKFSKKFPKNFLRFLRGFYGFVVDHHHVFERFGTLILKKKSLWAKIVKKTRKNGRVDHVQPHFSTPYRRERTNFMNVSDRKEPGDYFKH